MKFKRLFLISSGIVFSTALSGVAIAQNMVSSEASSSSSLFEEVQPISEKISSTIIDRLDKLDWRATDMPDFGMGNPFIFAYAPYEDVVRLVEGALSDHGIEVYGIEMGDTGIQYQSVDVSKMTMIAVSIADDETTMVSIVSQQ